MGWGAESAGRGFVPVLVGCGVPCPRVGEGGALRYGGIVLCGGLPVRGGGHRVQVWWGGLSPVVCPLAVWSSPAWSLDRSPGVFQYVACAGSVWHRAWGSLGRGVRDWSVATRGVWSCGAWGCRPAVGWARWCGALLLRGPRAGGSRLLRRVVAPVRCPRVVSGGVWLGCIVPTVGGGLFARVWGGPVVGCRRVATEPHLWLMSKIPTRTWDDCRATSERKGRTHSYDDLVDLLIELALERENDSHMEKFLKKHLVEVVPLPPNVAKGSSLKIPLTPTREVVKEGVTYVP